MDQQARHLSIEIYSDVVCPWCYIGKRRLERALEGLGGSVIAQIAWRPFQLNPTMPQNGMDRKEYLEAKFGSLEAFKTLEEHLQEAGRSERIPFAFEKVARTPNTFQAHRLIWYAAQQGCQNEIVDRLFQGYFEEGADIGSTGTLVQLASETGLQAESFLNSVAGTEEVKAEEAAGHRLGIRGVPYFVLNQTLGVSGAQPADVLIAAIDTAPRQLEAMSGNER